MPHSEHEDRTQSVLLASLKCRDVPSLRQALAGIAAGKLADIVVHLESQQEQLLLFRLSSPREAGEAFLRLDATLLNKMIVRLDTYTLVAIFDQMAPDDITDILQHTNRASQAKIISLLKQQDSEDVRMLMRYLPDTAGGNMNTNFISLAADKTVADSVAMIRAFSEDEVGHYVYVTAANGSLVGSVSLKSLLLSDKNRPIREITDHQVISVNVFEDQEEVALLFKQHDLILAPVVDDDNGLIGVISVDDILDIIREENDEDIYRLSGIDHVVVLNGPVMKNVSSRLPWLLISLVGGFINSRILKLFTPTLNQVLALAFFLPLIMGMGGNVGTQTATITVRGIATGDIDFSHLRAYIWKQMQVSLVMGLVCGLCLALFSVVAQGPTTLVWSFAPILGFSLFVCMFIAATMGTVIPLVLRHRGIDPALASGAFVSTATDMIGIILYLGMATSLLSYFAPSL